MAGEPSDFVLKVGHDKFTHDVQVPSTGTFGDVKRNLVELAYLQPEEQRILFRGREVRDEELLAESGVKNGTKLMLLENLAAKERKTEEARIAQEQAKAVAAIGAVQKETNDFASQVARLETSVKTGAKLEDKDFAILSELLMRQLLKLDGIAAEGEAKQLRRSEVKRIQALVDEVDRLKGVNQSQASLAGAPSPTSSAAQAFPWTFFNKRTAQDDLQPAPAGAGSFQPAPTQNENPYGFMSSWEKFDSGANVPQQVQEIDNRQTGPLTNEKVETKSMTPLVPQNPRNRPPSPRRKSLSRSNSSNSLHGADSSASAADESTDSVSSLRTAAAPSPPQKSQLGTNPPRNVLRPRRSISLQNLSLQGNSPPTSPAAANSPSTASSRSPSPSVVDTISTFPSTAVPKIGPQSPRTSGSRKPRYPVSASPSSPSSTSSQSPLGTLSSFPATAVPKLGTKSKAATPSPSSLRPSPEQAKPSSPEVLEFSTFPATAIPRSQLSPQSSKPDLNKVKIKHEVAGRGASGAGSQARAENLTARAKVVPDIGKSTPPETRAAVPARHLSNSPVATSSARPNPPAGKPNQSSHAPRKVIAGLGGQMIQADRARPIETIASKIESMRAAGRLPGSQPNRSPSGQSPSERAPQRSSSREDTRDMQSPVGDTQPRPLSVVDSQPLLRRSIVVSGGGEPSIRTQPASAPDLMSFGTPAIDSTGPSPSASDHARPSPSKPYLAQLPHYPQPGQVSTSFYPVGRVQVEAAQTHSLHNAQQPLSNPFHPQVAPQLAIGGNTSLLPYTQAVSVNRNPYSTDPNLGSSGGVVESPMVFANTNPFAYPSPPRTPELTGPGGAVSYGLPFSQPPQQQQPAPRSLEPSWEKF